MLEIVCVIIVIICSSSTWFSYPGGMEGRVDHDVGYIWYLDGFPVHRQSPPIQV